MGTWEGGKEKAPAAICRKIASVGDMAQLKSGVMELRQDHYFTLMSA